MDDLFEKLFRSPATNTNQSRAANASTSRAVAGLSPIFPDYETRSHSYDCAMAVLGGRFTSVKKALAHEEFRAASPKVTGETYDRLKGQPLAVQAAVGAESQRKQKQLALIVNSVEPSARDDMAWQEDQFEKLLARANASALRMPEQEKATWRWAFERTNRYDRRYFAFKFQYAVYSDLVEHKSSTRLQGGNELYDLARYIFSDCAYCTRQIRHYALAKISEPSPMGAPTSMPRHVESVLFRLVSKLRSMRCPVYKSTVIFYAQTLLKGTAIQANFSQTDEHGDFKLDKHGRLQWDSIKFDNWVYRRLISDRKAVSLHAMHACTAPLPSPPPPTPLPLAWQEGVTTGRQVILDVHRAKWHSFEAMEPYFRTHVQALVDEGIAFYNENYDEEDVDDNGVPKEPIAFWFPDERWRCVPSSTFLSALLCQPQIVHAQSTFLRRVTAGRQNPW